MAAYWGIAAHSAYDIFSWYKYLSVILVFFPPLGLLSGNFFLIAPFPDHSLFVLFFNCQNICHGFHVVHGLLRLPIPFPCVASRLSRFDHVCLKCGCRDRRKHSVNATFEASSPKSKGKSRL